MKHINYFLYYLFRPIGLILIASLLCNVIATAQEAEPTEFTIGTTLSREPNNNIFDSLKVCGFNTIVWIAYKETKQHLDFLNARIIASTADRREDWI